MDVRFVVSDVCTSNCFCLQGSQDCPVRLALSKIDKLAHKKYWHYNTGEKMAQTNKTGCSQPRYCS